ncbi:bifunctional 4-hydroxy-2-oxoglutarate aldolase/2-dehydro-3-deoxy-phosphogluconate aldolase [Enterococcus sp. AZ072]|uniref:bifunctional 4-hydroxy-2-oxoglutarate aldolase/2-dehydro-3-deoxy-phosphogluconate aldolase n=1 Tax=unclassified Enterococcus TaxID=2608891 RepID=UPI003D270CCC
MKSEVNDFIEENKVIAICRGIYGEKLINLVTALNNGGVKLVEVTFDQGDPECLIKTSNAIASLVKEFGDEVKIGAGTVLTKEQVESAHQSGAEYIISPNTNPTVIKRTKELDMISMPGALSPSEIIMANEAGADFVKVFPVRALGTGYIKDILGPINHIKLIATAGVTRENLQDYLDLGFCGAGISGYLTDKRLVDSGDFATIENHAQEMMSIVRDNKVLS